MRGALASAPHSIRAPIMAAIDVVPAAVQAMIHAVAFLVETVRQTVAIRRLGPFRRAVQFAVDAVTAIIETPFDAIAAIVDAIGHVVAHFVSPDEVTDAKQDYRNKYLFEKIHDPPPL